MLAPLAALAFTASQAKADLLYQGFVDQGGTGHGAVPTILTMQSHGNGTVESGMVSWDGTQTVVTADPIYGPTGLQLGPTVNNMPTGYTPAGSTDMVSINNAILVSDTGWTQGHGLGIMFNPVEPNGQNKSTITLNALEMTIYSPTGAVLFDAPWVADATHQGPPLTVDASTNPGTGNSGYLFTLNAAEIAELNAAGITGDDHIGLLAYATNADGGPETFYGTVVACNNDKCTPDPVPEPIGLSLLGIGLLGLGTVRYGAKLIS
jgi:hypothetical protein